MGADQRLHLSEETASKVVGVTSDKNIFYISNLEEEYRNIYCGYLSGARCRLVHSPADATATHCLLLQ